MKKLFKTTIALVLFVAVYTNFGVSKIYAQPGISGTITYQNFYDDLSPYGNWIEYPGYGHAWSPNVAGDFRPYLTNGNWNYTTDGWTWMSNYAWGWAPFHYGRWLYEDAYGWLWIPGYEWSPAWVTWGEYDNYYAWAPLFPGVNVGFSYNNWRPNSMYWNVVPRNHIYDRDVYNYAESRNRDASFVNRITVINNYNSTSLHNQYYARGPEIRDVEKYTGQKISPARLNSVDRAMPAKREGDNLQVYRPTVLHPQPAAFKRVTQDSPPMMSNQNERMNTQTERMNTQTERMNTEVPKSNTQVVRANSDAQKVNNEVSRSNTQTQRMNTEAQKANTEVARANNEAQKVNNEVLRSSTQVAKMSNEVPKANNEMQRTNAEMQRANTVEARTNAMTNRQENMDVRNSEMRSETPINQNREETRMPVMERSQQMQNINRLPERMSPPSSFQRSQPSNAGMKRR